MATLFHNPRPSSAAAIKLFCFPFAGGSSSLYAPWLNKIDTQVEMILVDLPGRGRRMSEPAYNDMNSLAQDALMEIIPLIDRPYVFFGYSLGAKIAFELMLKLRNIGFPLPINFVAAASPAPHLPRRAPLMHSLSDNELLFKLADYNGISDAVLQDKELMTLLLPSLRADFTILEKYTTNKPDLLSNNLTIYGGESDPKITHEDLLAWQEIFRLPAEYRLFKGGHFFINESSALFDELNKLLKREIAAVTA